MQGSAPVAAGNQNAAGLLDPGPCHSAPQGLGGRWRRGLWAPACSCLCHALEGPSACRTVHPVHACSSVTLGRACSGAAIPTLISRCGLRFPGSAFRLRSFVSGVDLIWRSHTVCGPRAWCWFFAHATVRVSTSVPLGVEWASVSCTPRGTSSLVDRHSVVSGLRPWKHRLHLWSHGWGTSIFAGTACLLPSSRAVPLPGAWGRGGRAGTGHRAQMPSAAGCGLPVLAVCIFWPLLLKHRCPPGILCCTASAVELITVCS